MCSPSRFRSGFRWWLDNAETSPQAVDNIRHLKTTTIVKPKTRLEAKISSLHMRPLTRGLKGSEEEAEGGPRAEMILPGKGSNRCIDQ